MERRRKRYRSGRLVTQRRPAGAIRTHCKGGRGRGILVFCNKRKSPLQERAVSILSRWNGVGMGAVLGYTACREYITRQTLKQDHSSPSLSPTR